MKPLILAPQPCLVRLIVPLLALGLACSTSTTDTPPPGTLAIVSGGISFGDPPFQTDYAFPESITAMAVYDGDILVGTNTGVFIQGALGFEEFPVFATLGNPMETGAVQAMTPRSEGILIAADNGLFHTFEWALLASPLSELLTGQTVRALSCSGSNDDETVWVDASDGLFRITNTSFDAVSFPDQTGVPSALGALEDSVLVAYGDTLYDLSPDDWTFTTAPEGLGVITTIVTDGQTAYMASDQGLVVRHSGGGYTRYTLSDTDTAKGVLHVTLNNVGTATALTADGIVSLGPDGPSALAPITTESNLLSVDGFGDVWVSNAESAARLSVGDTVTFAPTVSDIIATECNGCHAEGSVGPKHDFTNYGVVLAMADTILERVATKQMPQGYELEIADYETILSWFASGMNP